jgi:hypothetical protein
MTRVLLSRALVAHACNPSYSRGRDQEDCSLKPAGANSSRDLILKKLFKKIGLVEWLKVKALSSVLPKKKKKKKKLILKHFLKVKFLFVFFHFF